LGNNQLGDGYRFRGRGYIQLTGRHNYRHASAQLGIPLLEHPELAEQPEYAARIAGWYWFQRALNRLADGGEFRQITRVINGGYNGLARSGTQIQYRQADIIRWSRIPVSKVKASLKEFGWRQPIVVDTEGVIIVGHTRYLAALELGWQEAPVHVGDNLTPAQVKAYRIADNRTGAESQWDMDLLALEFDDLREAGIDMALTGFDQDELATPGEVGSEGDTDPQVDRAEELRVKWGVEVGQLWTLGEHRLLCGDSTKAEDVARLMQGEKADLCFTSPPYGQQRDYRDGATEKVSDWDTLMQGVFGNLPMSDAGQVLVNLGLIHRDNEWIPYWDGWIQWMRQQGWRRFGWYVWDKLAGMPGDWNGRLAPSYEFVWHFNKKAVRPTKFVECKDAGRVVQGRTRGKNGELRVHTASKNGDAVQSHKIPDDVIRLAPAKGDDNIHPAVFPVALPEFVIQSWPGLIYEPFSGSGTTIIAAENLKRKARAIEISPAYVAVALERYLTHTGKTPTRL
jgi:DNA modification methylase